MNMREDVFTIVFYGLISLFVIVLIFFLGTNVILGHISPLVKHLAPSGNTGLGRDRYLGLVDLLSNGFNWIFYLFLAIPLFFIVVKLFYEKEETSVIGD